MGPCHRRLDRVLQQLAEPHRDRAFFGKGKDVMMKIKKRITLFLLALLLCSCADGKDSSRDVSELLKGALQTLGVEKGSPDLCVLTDATYVKLGGGTTETYMEMIGRETGCSIGKGNLLFFNGLHGTLSLSPFSIEKPKIV